MCSEAGKSKKKIKHQSKEGLGGNQIRKRKKKRPEKETSVMRPALALAMADGRVGARKGEVLGGVARSGMVVLTVPYACGTGVGSGWGALFSDWSDVSRTVTVRVNCRVSWRVLCQVCNRSTQPSPACLFISQ